MDDNRTTARYAFAMPAAAPVAPTVVPRLRHPATLLSIAALWTVFGALSAAQLHVRDATGGQAAPWRGVFNIVYFYWAWALVTPGVVWAYARIERDGRPTIAQALLHVPAALAVDVVQALLYSAFQLVAGDTTDSLLGGTPLAVARHSAGNLLTYAAVVAILAGMGAYRRSQQRALEALRAAQRTSELEAALTRVRLDALMAQLRPHFLFNTLNIVSALVSKQDAVAANRVIARLGDLLRATLAAQAEPEIPLGRELELTRHYLEIARLRHGARLAVNERIDPGTLARLVPPFVLQPIVENAVEHGMGDDDRATWIDIDTHLDGGTLVVSVADSGPGFAATAAMGRDAGIGLTIVRDRLRQLYGDAAELRAEDAGGGGARVTIRLASVARSAP